MKGQDLDALRKLTVLLARGCIFGDAVLKASSFQGKNNLNPLDRQKLEEIKHIVHKRSNTSGNEFELQWKCCLESLRKTMQNLRSGRLKRLQFS